MLTVADFVSTIAAARKIGVSSRTLARWARDNYVTPAIITRGGQYRWDVDDLLRQLRDKHDGSGQ